MIQEKHQKMHAERFKKNPLDIKHFPGRRRTPLVNFTLPCTIEALRQLQRKPALFLVELYGKM